MTCPSCGHENPAGARFCNGCGTTLEGLCPRCGKPNPAGSRFCNSCGGPLQAAAIAERVTDPRSYTPKHLAEKILTTRSALEGERKQVTVLFADVKGSMDLAEHVDPEEWHRVLDRFFQILSEGVHRFEGTINQFTGDGIMALFGAPIAHEDHARRACYAVLHLKDELRRYSDELRLARGLNFSVRMGLNSGEVVVGKIGDDLRMDYTAQGHTVGLAARMEQIAQPGSIYVTDQTAKLVSGFFTLRDLGNLEVKGAQGPVRVYELTGLGALRTKLDVSRARGFSRFVGRDEETASLEAALDRALAGTGKVVGVVGDAGVGKSRLCFEFVERSRTRGVAVYEARCVSHGKMIPFLPILEMLRGYFGLAEQDRNEEARRKIAGTLLLLDEELTEALPLLFDFLGVPDPERPVQRMDPEARQRQLFAFVKRLIHARSRREPAVLLMEDLHWIDGGSEGFLAEAVEAVAGTRTLLLTNFRPEYRAGWMQRSHYQQLPLLPLRPEEVSEMLSHLLGRDSSLTGLADHICGRTGGNPFFIEEVVQSLVETESIVGTTGAYRLAKPVAKLVIPATVQAVLAARIDRLADREKAVLQTAAVIGKEVPQRVLTPVTELPETELAGALAALVRGEFLYEKVLYPDAEYTFKHPLTQEVAYHSQLAARRARIHRAVAQTIAYLSAHRLDESAALLAYHWEGAGEALEAARWHRRAGERQDRESVVQGLEHWLRVRTLLVQVPESAETAELVTRACSALLRAAGIAVAGVEEPGVVFSHGRGLAERFGNTRALAGLLNNYAVFKALAAGELGEAIELATEARNLEGAYSSSPVVDLVWMLCASGRVREGLEVAERAVSATRKGEWVEGFLAHSWALYFRAFPLMYAGRAREAERDLEEAIEEAGRGGEPIVVGQAHGLRVHVATVTGEVEAALGHARRALEIVEKSGARFWQMFGWWSLGEAHLLRGEWTDAATALERAVAITREIGIADPWEAWRLARLAEAYLGAGDLPRARKTAKFALDSARRRGTRLSEIAALLSLARVLLKSEGEPAHEAIHSALARAQALVEKTGATSYAPFLHVERAEVALLSGDEATRERELREAHRLFLEIGAPIRAEQVAKELAG